MEKDYKKMSKLYKQFILQQTTEGYEKTINISDALKECGYNNFSEFVEDNSYNYLKTANIKFPEDKPLSSIKDVLDFANYELTADPFVPSITRFVSDGTIAFHGINLSDEQREVLDNNGIKRRVYAGEGGVIISGEKDCNVIFILDGNNCASYEFIIKLFRDIFEKLTGKKFTIDNNDILDENDNKVFGAALFPLPGTKLIMSTFTAIEDHSELIDKLCLKQQTKEDKAKSAGVLEGVTWEDIKAEWEKICKEG